MLSAVPCVAVHTSAHVSLSIPLCVTSGVCVHVWLWEWECEIQRLAASLPRHCSYFGVVFGAVLCTNFYWSPFKFKGWDVYVCFSQLKDVECSASVFSWLKCLSQSHEGGERHIWHFRCSSHCAHPQSLTATTTQWRCLHIQSSVFFAAKWNGEVQFDAFLYLLCTLLFMYKCMLQHACLGPHFPNRHIVA